MFHDIWFGFHQNFIPPLQIGATGQVTEAAVYDHPNGSTQVAGESCRLVDPSVFLYKTFDF